LSLIIAQVVKPHLIRVAFSVKMAHMYVDASIRGVSDFDYPVWLATDALTYGELTFPAEHVHAAFLSALKSYGHVMWTEDILKQVEG